GVQACGLPISGDRRGPRGRVAFGPDPPYALDLAPLAVRIDALDRRRVGLLVLAPGDTDDDLLAAIDRQLGPIRCLLDRALLEAGVEGLQGSARGLDLGEVFER